MPRDDIKLETKSKIYDFIYENPGVYQREISKKLGISRSTLRHHIRYLTNENLITIESNNGYSRYYTTNKISERDKEILSVIREETPRNILIILIANIVCSQYEIGKELDKKPSTINFHLKKLMELDLIETALIKDGLICRNKPSHFVNRQPIKREKIYKLKDKKTVKTVRRLFIQHKKSISELNLYSETLYYFDNWKSLRQPKILNGFSERLDDAIEVLLDFLCAPFFV